MSLSSFVPDESFVRYRGPKPPSVALITRGGHLETFLLTDPVELCRLFCEAVSVQFDC